MSSLNSWVDPKSASGFRVNEPCNQFLVKSVGIGMPCKCVETLSTHSYPKLTAIRPLKLPSPTLGSAPHRCSTYGSWYQREKEKNESTFAVGRTMRRDDANVCQSGFAQLATRGWGVALKVGEGEASVGNARERQVRIFHTL